MKTLIETPTFLADVRASKMTEAEYDAILASIAKDPTQGDLMRETGGAHTARFAGRSKGKSGGYRVVFYPAPDDVPAILITLVNKGDRENLSRGDRIAVSKMLAGYVEDYRNSAKAKVIAMKRKPK